MPTDDPEPERQRSYWGCVRHGVALRVRRRVPRRHGTGGWTRAQLDRGVGAREEGGARTAARRCAGVAAPGGPPLPGCSMPRCGRPAWRRGSPAPCRVAETGARRLAAAHAPPLSPVTGAPGARHLRGPELTDGNEQGVGVVVEQPVRRPRTRRSSEILRRRRPLRLPHRPRRRSSGASRPDTDQSTAAMTPGAPAPDEPG
jgi:hypothetical protein